MCEYLEEAGFVAAAQGDLAKAAAHEGAVVKHHKAIARAHNPRPLHVCFLSRLQIHQQPASHHPLS